MAWRGELAAATALAAEADALAEAVGIRFLQFGTPLLAALRGDENQSPRLLQSTIDRGTESQDGTPVQIAIWANAILLNGLARYDARSVVGPPGHRSAGGQYCGVGAPGTDRGGGADR